MAEQYQEEQLTRKAMELVLEDFMERQKSLEDRMCALQAQQQEQEAQRQSQHDELRHELEDEHKKRKSAERKVRDLEERLDCAYQELYGDRRQRVRKKARSGEPEKPEPDREKEKGDYDGTDDTLRTGSVDDNRPQEQPDKPLGERDLSNRPASYKRMGVVGNPVFHPSDLSRVPGRVIERKTVQVFSLRTCLVEERFEMVHYAAPGQKPKWGYFPSDGHPEVVTRLEGTKATPEFLQSIAYVFIGMFISNELKSARFKDTVHQVCVAHGRNNFVKAWNQGHKPNARLFV